MIGKCHELADARIVEAGKAVKRKAAVGRNRVAVRSGERPRRHALRNGAAVERGAIQVALGRVLRRGHEVQPAGPLVDAHLGHRVHVAARDQRLAAVPRDAIDVPPSVLLRRDEELGAVAPRAGFRETTEPDGVNASS
jgi:hypothetical protein